MSSRRAHRGTPSDEPPQDEPPGAGPPPTPDLLADADVVEQVQRQLEETLLGGPRRYTREDMAREAGVPLERARRLWVAMGFAQSDDESAVLFHDADLRALREVTRLVDDGVVKPEMEVSIVRALGQSLSRLAEWETDLVRRYVADRLAGAAEAGEEVDARRLADELGAITASLLPTIEGLQTYTWRRHLVANSVRVLAGAGDDEVGERRLVVGFSDIVGYTRLTRQLSPEQLDDLIERFEQATTSVIAERHGWVVKTVGDEVMFAVEDPRDAALIALELTERIGADEVLPGIRTGLALGPVLVRFGDAFGHVVNTAARLTSVAKPDTVLVDPALAEALEGVDGLHLRSMRPVRVHGMRRLAPHALRRDHS